MKIKVTSVLWICILQQWLWVIFPNFPLILHLVIEFRLIWSNLSILTIIFKLDLTLDIVTKYGFYKVKKSNRRTRWKLNRLQRIFCMRLFCITQKLWRNCHRLYRIIRLYRTPNKNNQLVRCNYSYQYKKFLSLFPVYLPLSTHMNHSC